MFAKLAKVLPVLREVVELIEAIADCADDGGVTLIEGERLAAALEALSKRVRIKGKPITFPPISK